MVYSSVDSGKMTAVLAVASCKDDIADGYRRIRISGVVLVPDDFPETHRGSWEKWLSLITIEPARRFRPTQPVGDAAEAMLSLGSDSLDQWEEVDVFPKEVRHA